MITAGKIDIYTYKGKLSKKYYKIAYFDHQFNFVHVSRDKLCELKVKHNKKGRKYLEYVGNFSFNKERQEIDI